MRNKNVDDRERVPFSSNLRDLGQAKAMADAVIYADSLIAPLR